MGAGAGAPPGFPAFPLSAAMQGEAEMIQRLNTAMKKTSASPACGNSQLQERGDAFLERVGVTGVVWAAGEGRVVCEQIPEFK